MGNHNWTYYFRWSLCLHLAVLSALGLALQQAPGPDLQKGPIRVKVEGFGPGANTGAGKDGDGSGEMTGTESTAAVGSRLFGPPGAASATGEASLSSETTLRELLQTPVAPSAADGSGDSAGGVSGNRDRSAESGMDEAGSSGEGSGSGTGLGSGAGNGTDPVSAGGDGSPGGGAGGSGSAGGADGTDLSQDAALQGYSRIYPRAARDAGEEGVAVVGVSVSAGGSVTRAWLEESTGYDRLDRAALKAAYQWSFTPARNAAGEPIAGESRVTVRYQLEE